MFLTVGYLTEKAMSWVLSSSLLWGRKRPLRGRRKLRTTTEPETSPYKRKEGDWAGGEGGDWAGGEGGTYPHGCMYLQCMSISYAGIHVVYIYKYDMYL